VSSELTIVINNKNYAGIESAYIHKSMNSITGWFILTMENIFNNDADAFDIKIGDIIEIRIEDQSVINGYIDKLHFSYDDGSNDLTITGRDKTGDLIDCSYDNKINEWLNQSALNLLKNLCAPFGIDVFVDKSATTQANIKFDRFKVNEGEFVFDIIFEICNKIGVLPISMGDGKLTLTQSSSSVTDEVIEERLKADLILSNENRFSDYIIKGIDGSTNDKNSADYISPYGTFQDPVISRTRPLVILADQPVSSKRCQEMARWEAKTRAGLSRVYLCTVAGWVRNDDTIWDINSLVNIIDSILDIDDRLLISDINYILNEDDGEITELTFIDKDAYSVNDESIKIKTRYDR